MSKKNKVFIVSGEASGDQSGAWYLNKIANDSTEYHAVGGLFLKAAGAEIYENIDKLNVTGFVEILGKLIFIFKFLWKVSNYIVRNNFKEVILIDFPGFNLILAKRLKRIKPDIKIIYLSPPQVWVWGARRVKKIKKYCDKVIVLYPFEVEWYKKRGVNVEFIGNPLCDKLNNYFNNDFKIKNQIAILPGSRKQEIIHLLPIFAKIIKKIKLLYPKIKIVLPVANSLDKRFIEIQLRKYNLFNHGKDVFLVTEEIDKIKALRESILAITKPGTVTLELALLNVPSLIFYKTSWITYLLANMVVRVKYMGLPNLFLNKAVFKEFIQGDCNVNLIFNYVKKLYVGSLKKDDFYNGIQRDLKKLKKDFCI